MADLSPQQRDALALVIRATVEAVASAGPLGAPGGVLYAAMMAHGVTLRQFEGLMGALVRTKTLSQRGDCYFVTERARQAYG